MSLDKLEDKRIGCLSLMTSMPVGDFIGLVDRAYETQGGLKGQRPALKTKTALTIRNRLVSDLRDGAVVPPVVIGIQCLDSSLMEQFKTIDNNKELLELVSQLPVDSISIIDGMQRTTAFLEAADDKFEFFEKSIQRFEFWIADNVGSLVYRMLVLNTGQVPWEIARQLETVYSQFLQRLRHELGDGIQIFQRDEDRRRRDAGQYQASVIIRLFLTFASRRMEFDLKDRIAEDFARLDTVEASSHDQFFSLFVEALKLLVSLDEVFSKAGNSGLDEQARIVDGRSIFLSFPALVGFITAVAITVMDEPGFTVDWESAPSKMEHVKTAVRSLTERLRPLNPSEVSDFLALETLNQRLAVRTGQVGRFEREVFYKAFDSMIRNAHRLENMEPCWLA
jgi:hypothetical protein